MYKKIFLSSLLIVLGVLLWKWQEAAPFASFVSAENLVSNTSEVSGAREETAQSKVSSNPTSLRNSNLHSSVSATRDTGTTATQVRTGEQVLVTTQTQPNPGVTTVSPRSSGPSSQTTISAHPVVTANEQASESTTNGVPVYTAPITIITSVQSNTASQPAFTNNQAVTATLPTDQNSAVVGSTTTESPQETTTAAETTSVEYYSQNRQDGRTTYLGAGQNNANGTYSLHIDAATRLPNGEYDVTTKVANSKGTVAESALTRLEMITPENNLSPLDKVKFENSLQDSDGDSISDQEEIRLGTNPLLADTDGDGFLDGDEVKNGFDPLKASTGSKNDKIIFASPKNVAATSNQEDTKKVDDKRFTVEAVKIVKTQNNEEKKVTRFSGKALPNTFVTVYIYSDPIIVTVKTDAEGNWTYDLDKELPDGDHEVYVAVTDNVGKITAQSSPLPFVKTAQAVTVKSINVTAEEAIKNASPLENSRTKFFLVGVIIALSFLGIALIVIGRKSTMVQ